MSGVRLSDLNKETTYLLTYLYCPLSGKTGKIWRTVHFYLNYEKD